MSQSLSSPIRNVTGTAFVVAEFRADENRAHAPVYRDDVVDLFLSDASREAASRMAARFPPVKDMVKVRTKYLDDTLEKQLASEFRQVLILGAGLDTRAVRKQARGVTYFEIDDPATLDLKRRCYADQGIDVPVTFIHGNYVTDGLIDLLRRHRFDFDQPTYIIWEGNTMYLPLEGVTQTIADLRQHVRRFRISFDYMTDAVITHGTGDAGVTTLVESFAAMGAPWLTGFRDIQAMARENRLTLLENFKTRELGRQFWRERPFTSAIFEHYRLCTMES
jgi:methyltransferase (TIGR00027 family)